MAILGGQSRQACRKHLFNLNCFFVKVVFATLME
jgi:hypothetical protein